MVQYTRFSAVPPRSGTTVRSLLPPVETRPEASADSRQEVVIDRLRRSVLEATAPVAAARLHPLVAMLMFSLVLPISFNFGSLHLSPNRLLLLLAFVPLVIGLLTGKCGRVRATDVLMGACCVWMAIAMFAFGGTSTIQYIGINTVEIFGAYLLARRYIRTEAEYLGLVRVLLWIAILLAPAAAIEALTKVRIYTKLFDPLFAVFPWANYEPRWGMSRAQTVFEHPILYGVYVALLFSPVYFVARQAGGRIKAWISGLPVLAATFFSLSAGAYLGLSLQLLLMGWGFVMAKVPGHWRILGVLTVIAYIVVDVISNRTPFDVFISYLTFNSGTSYMRKLIFVYGMENVWANPLFGIGLGDWVRPEWMFASSVDNYWLVVALRYGIPGFLLMLGAYLGSLIGLFRAKPASESVRRHRDALAFSLIGLGIAICTVHLWSAVFVFMMFMLGAGAWTADAPQVAPKAGVRPDPATRSR